MVYPFPCSDSPPRSCANYYITWHREHLCHERRETPPILFTTASQQFLLSTHCPNDMSSCLYLCIPAPMLTPTMWTLNTFIYSLVTNFVTLPEWSELLQVSANTRHYLDVCVPDTPRVPCAQSGGCLVTMRVCGPGVTCSWHRPMFRAQPLRVASRGNRSAQPRARPGTFHSAGLLAHDAK